MKITMVDLHGQYERIREEINNAIQEVLDTTAFINGPQRSIRPDSAPEKTAAEL